MKNLYLLTIILLLSATACKKENIAKQSEYDASFKAWISFRDNAKNAYSYTTSFGSWTGFAVTIKTNVSDGKITSRDYARIQYSNDGTNKADTIKTWHEDTTTINTHPDDAAQALTIDDIYLKARTQWLKADVATNDIIFEANNNGIISSCGFVPHNCADDCFNGVKITSITAL
jgi:hypothetical protein